MLELLKNGLKPMPATFSSGPFRPTAMDQWKADILLVDDDPATLLALESVLEPLGQNLLLARSGDDAFREVLRHDLAMILLDVRMPGMDGFEIARMIRARERSRHTPIIFLTGVAAEMESALRGYEIGAVDFLMKPIVPEFLRSKVSVFVELQRQNATLAAEIRERRAVEEQYRESEQRLRALATRLVAIREEERTRIAREIHDELGQVLTGLRMDVTWLARKFGDKNKILAEKSQAMTQLIDSTVHLVRRISTGMRPEVVDHMGLVEAIQWQAREFQKRTGIRCKCKLPAQNAELDGELSNAVFRTFQEMLTNVSRHAQASKVEVALTVTPEQLLLEVADDGLGVPPAKIADASSLGIIGMRERAQLFGGEFLLDGRRGTKGTLRIPLAPLGLTERRDNRDTSPESGVAS